MVSSTLASLASLVSAHESRMLSCPECSQYVLGLEMGSEFVEWERNPTSTGGSSHPGTPHAASSPSGAHARRTNSLGFSIDDVGSLRRAVAQATARNRLLTRQLRELPQRTGSPVPSKSGTNGIASPSTAMYVTNGRCSDCANFRSCSACSACAHSGHRLKLRDDLCESCVKDAGKASKIANEVCFFFFF